MPLILLMLLAGCAATPQLDEATESRLPRQAQLEGIPFHAQQDYQCGPASLAMVLNAQGVDVGVDDLIPQVFVPGKEGSVQPEMLATVRRHGRIPFVIRGELDSLLTEIHAGEPVVVMQNLSLPAWPVWHYAVAIGYDLDAEELTLHSGEEPGRVESFKRFDATWARSDRWAFVALPPGELPETIDAEAAIRAVSSWERAQAPEAALPAWRGIVERFPESAMARFAHGNALHGAGDSEAAITAFEAAVARDPDLDVAWLNLGLLHRDRGDTDAARKALERVEGRWEDKAREALAGLAEAP